MGSFRQCSGAGGKGYTSAQRGTTSIKNNDLLAFWRKVAREIMKMMEWGILLFVFQDSLEFFFLEYCLRMWLFWRKNWGPSCIPDFSLV